MFEEVRSCVAEPESVARRLDVWRLDECDAATLVVGEPDDWDLAPPDDPDPP